jgi:osmotically-inducible protein OsmY
MHKPNNLLESDVRASLDWDPSLDDSRIVVSADDGRVTLSGSVPSFYEEMLATDDAWTVGGVKALEDNLLVGPLGDAIADADIATACEAALDHDRIVPHGSVTATVLEGTVTLRGEVRRHFQRRAAEFAVSRVDGVLGVENLISISSEPIPSDVADRINKAFERNAIIDDSRITVTSDGHTINLDGTVGSYAALQQAEDTAWAAPGVTEVDDHLVIEP